MQVVEITKHGGPGVLEVFERSDPPLLPGEVRIDVAACGINFADVMARIGVYPDAPKPPCIVGYEVAGTVIDLGDGVEDLERGQRVLAGTKFNGYASQVCVPETDAVVLPDRLTFEQGAAIPVNYATAWAALVGYGSIQPGVKVLVHSAGGGVGISPPQPHPPPGNELLPVRRAPADHEGRRLLWPLIIGGRNFAPAPSASTLPSDGTPVVWSSAP